MNFSIVCVGMTGQHLSFQVSSETCCGEVKDKLKELLGLKQDGKHNIFLKFEGMSLEDDCKSLFSLGVSVDSKIAFVVSSDEARDVEEIEMEFQEQDVSHFISLFYVSF